MMFTGLTAATLLGVPFGAWFGLSFGWRSAFWAVAAIGVVAFIVLVLLVPNHVGRNGENTSLREELTVLARPQVQLGLATTVLGFAGRCEVTAAVLLPFPAASACEDC
jgi:DHA1 family inner membrane transport protein